jgi:hypothetical protein
MQACCVRDYAFSEVPSAMPTCRPFRVGKTLSRLRTGVAIDAAFVRAGTAGGFLQARRAGPRECDHSGKVGAVLISTRPDVKLIEGSPCSRSSIEGERPKTELEAKEQEFQVCGGLVLRPLMLGCPECSKRQRGAVFESSPPLPSPILSALFAPLTRSARGRAVSHQSRHTPAVSAWRAPLRSC